MSESLTGTEALTVGVLGTQSVVPATAAIGQIARTFPTGLAAACAGIGGNGTTFAVDGAGECVVTSGARVGLSLGSVLGLGEIILRADAITGSCTATDTTHEASATLTNAVVVARLVGIDTVLLILEETPAPGTVLGVPGVLSITLNQQASSGTDHVTATALEVVKVNAALSEVAIGVVECTGGADTTPPVITVSNVFAEATGPAGATAAFTPTATMTSMARFR